MDSNEEFQFKPITKGLGFQKKSDDTSAPASAPVTAQSVSRMISSLPNLDFQDKKLGPAPQASLLHTPLPRASENKSTHLGPIPGIPARDSKFIPRSAPTLADAAPAPQANVQARTTSGVSSPLAPAATALGAFKKSVANGSSGTTIVPKVQPLKADATSSSPLQPSVRVPADVQTQTSLLPETVTVGEQRLVESPFNILAGLFDAFVVLGLTCIFAVVLLLMTGTDLALVISNARSDVATQFGVLLLVSSVYALYMVVTRCFFGFTLGEWAFDMRLGLPHEQRAAWYPLAVAWRFLAVFITGLVALPILSLILRRDLTARVTGIRLYRQA